MIKKDHSNTYNNNDNNNDNDNDDDDDAGAKGDEKETTNRRKGETLGPLSFSSIFADPFDKEDLGISMMKVLKYPRLRGRLARMGAHKARSLFTWTGIAQQLIALVENRPSSALVNAELEWDDPWVDAE